VRAALLAAVLVVVLATPASGWESKTGRLTAEAVHRPSGTWALVVTNRYFHVRRVVCTFNKGGDFGSFGPRDVPGHRHAAKRVGLHQPTNIGCVVWRPS
jgi:hypothetical protein